MPWAKDYDNSSLLAPEVEAIITRARAEAPLNPTSGVADRWPLLWLVLWTTGRRLGEVLAITGDCVRAGPATVGGELVAGALWYVPLKKKRRAWAVCGLKPPVAAELATLIGHHHVSKGERVFPMTHQGAAKAFKRQATAAGVTRPRGVHPHMLRHGHAHQLAGDAMARGAPPTVVMGLLRKALGHAGYGNLAQYLEPTQTELQAWQDKAF